MAPSGTDRRRHQRVIVVDGTLDADAGRRLLDVLSDTCSAASPGDDIELDLARVHSMTVGGIGALARSLRIGVATGTHVRFRMGGDGPGPID
jgi:hypothetical protein